MSPFNDHISADLDIKGWYPSDRERLIDHLDLYLNTEENLGPMSDMLAIIVPHAGHQYCGLLDGHGFSVCTGMNLKRIIVIGPSHFFSIPNRISMPALGNYQSPLGIAPIDTTCVRDLHEKAPELFTHHSDIHYKEHSIQTLVPFAQILFPGVPILPLIIGHSSKKSIREMATYLKPYVGPQTLLVISSDFTHYGEMFDYTPFTDNISERIKAVDFGALTHIYNMNSSEFYRYFEKNTPTICGEFAIKLMFELLPNNARGTLLDYRQSAQSQPTITHSVSYAAVAMHGKWK